MISPRPAQSSTFPPFFRSSSHLPAGHSATLFTLSRNSSKKSEIPVLSFQSLTAPSSTLFHSLGNKSRICTLFRKTPGVPPHSTQLLKFHLKSATLSPYSGFPIHYSPVSNHWSFPIWLLLASPAAQTMDREP